MQAPLTTWADGWFGPLCSVQLLRLSELGAIRRTRNQPSRGGRVEGWSTPSGKAAGLSGVQSA